MKEFINDKVANKIINDKQFDDYQKLISIYDQNKILKKQTKKALIAGKKSHYSHENDKIKMKMAMK